jgi:asparagine synthase (glutamine-hydrolysing)
MPLCDNEVIDFFQKVPLKYRETGYLYVKYAAERLFVNAFRDLRQIDCTTPLSDKVRLITVKNKLMQILWSRANFFNSRSFDAKAAIIWAIVGENPGLFQIKNKCFGYKPKSRFEFELMNEIMSHSLKTGFIPIANSLGTNAFLNQLIEEDNTSE